MPKFTFSDYENRLLKTALRSAGVGFIATDTNGIINMLNDLACQLSGWNQTQAVGHALYEVFRIEDEKTGKPLKLPLEEAAGSGTIATDYRIMLRTKTNALIPVSYSISSVKNEEGIVEGFVLTFRDITLEREKIAAFEHVSYHDHLTGLYNRTYFERAMRWFDKPEYLPLTIVMADANGLKLANDSFGHDTGDVLLQTAASNIIKCCRENDIVARTGGDEFVILMPNTTCDEAAGIISKIKAECETHTGETIKLTLAFGWKTKTNSQQNIRDILKAAETTMYHNKIAEHPRVKSKEFSNIIQQTFHINKYEKQHSINVKFLCQLMSKALGMAPKEEKELLEAALLHDVGKISIDANILNKNGELSDEEWEEIKRHPETGYRIIKAVDSLSDAARFVLYHHERWDGKGYPSGIKGHQIPLAARIIAIAEAYDYMTVDRPYHKAISKAAALEELKLSAGTQFDPDLVQVFTKIINLKHP